MAACLNKFSSGSGVNVSSVAYRKFSGLLLTDTRGGIMTAFHCESIPMTGDGAPCIKAGH